MWQVQKEKYKVCLLLQVFRSLKCINANVVNVGNGARRKTGLH